MDMTDRVKRILYNITLAVTFVSALLYECLTPIYSDDMNYMQVVREARGIGDLFRQEADQYMNWTGRSVAHLILRFQLFFFGLDRRVFNVIAAVVFVCLILLMVRLVRRDEARDLRLLVLIVCGVWLTGVQLGQTVFWMTGACNYLFTTTILLGFFALYFQWTEDTAAGGKQGWLRILCLTLVGFLAGWCNENTSGGAVLFALLMLLVPLWERKKSGKARGMLPLRITALVGVSLGFLMQLLSPGNRSRTALIEERHEGLMLYAARFLKILASMEALFLPLLLIALFLLILALRQGTSLRELKLQRALLFLLLFFATAGCLILAPDPQTRVYFGPGIFLLIACAQLYETVSWEKEGAVLAALRDFAVWALLLVLIFRYCAEGGNLARIYREEQNRYALLEKGRGYETVYVPLLPEAFDSPYSMAYEVDLEPDWRSFPNMQMGGFYDIPVLVGVPFDEYDGRLTEEE